MNLKTKYMGLDLNNPVIVASSPFTTSLDRIKRLEEHGAGAVVLKSIFEEQVMGEAAFLETFNYYPEAADYLNSYVEDEYLKGHLKLIEEVKKSVAMPIIASINCQTKGRWVEYATAIESAGADALELNVFILPTDINQSSMDIEAKYLDIIESVTSKLKIPVSVKLGMRFTNVLSICRDIYYRHGRAVVMFNRFYEPDIDVESIKLTNSDSLSTNAELRTSLRTVAMCATQVPLLDIAVSTGVHTGEDAVKSILAGAKTVEVCSTLYHNGLGTIEDMKRYMLDWMVRHSFDSVDDFCGVMKHKKDNNEDIYQRVQYMKFFPKER